MAEGNFYGSGTSAAVADDERPTDPDGVLAVLPITEDWLGDYGGEIRVSLAALAHIGHGGATDGMIGSADSTRVSGEIAVPEARASRVETDELAWLRRRQRRKWAVALGCVALVGLAAWGLMSAEPEPASNEPLPSAHSRRL